MQPWTAEQNLIRRCFQQKRHHGRPQCSLTIYAPVQLISMIYNLKYRISRIFVKCKTLDSQGQVELVEVVEGHQVPISPKNIHFSFEKTHTLSVSRTGLLPDDKPVTIIINNLLLKLFTSVLLITYSFKSLCH